MSIRLEITPELAYLAPALEIVVGISALLERDDLGKLAKQQRKRPLGSYNTDSHIMLVKHKNIAVQTGFELAGNHNVVYRVAYIVLRVACLDAERPNRSSHTSGNTNDQILRCCYPFLRIKSGN